MVSALINSVSARGFSKACLVCHDFENLDFSLVAESTARAEVVGASDPRLHCCAPACGKAPPSPASLRCHLLIWTWTGRWTEAA